MPQSLAKILVHLIFSTKNRERFLQDNLRSELHNYLASILQAHDCPAILIGSVTDHVHVLFSQSKNRALIEVVEELKKSSSKWIKTKGQEYSGFYWQNGYGAFSVSQSNVDAVVKYIGNQAEHHRFKTFQEEYREFLDRYQVKYDEKFVWD